MKSRTGTFLFASFGIALMTMMSCGKSSNSTSNPNAAIITPGTYYVVKEEAKQSDGSYTTETMTTCQAAEFYNFAATKIFQGDSQSCGVEITGTWNYTTTTTVLTAIDGSTNQVYLQGTVSGLGTGGFVVTSSSTNLRLTFITTQ